MEKDIYITREGAMPSLYFVLKHTIDSEWGD